ncbi:MAG: hypothetical protein Q9M13_07875 [Mariprofundales bacterium]|nr:hypothetical protein [Mariprofundales bacterium]
MKYSELLDTLRRRRLVAGHVNAGDAYGTQVSVRTSLLTALDHYLVYMDGRVHMVNTAAPDRWWASPVGSYAVPTACLIDHLVADLGATRLLSSELRLLQTHGYAELVRERMR